MKTNFGDVHFCPFFLELTVTGKKRERKRDRAARQQWSHKQTANKKKDFFSCSGMFTSTYLGMQHCKKRISPLIFLICGTKQARLEKTSVSHSNGWLIYIFFTFRSGCLKCAAKTSLKNALLSLDFPSRSWPWREAELPPRCMARWRELKERGGRLGCVHGDSWYLVMN